MDSHCNARRDSRWLSEGWLFGRHGRESEEGIDLSRILLVEPASCDVLAVGEEHRHTWCLQESGDQYS